MKKISDTLFVDKEKQISVVQKPNVSNDWFVLDSKSAVIFRASKFSDCENFVSELDK